MVNQPIKLQNNLYLYSGDVITVNNGNSLLIEIIDDQDQTVKLRSIEKNKYLSKSKNLLIRSLKFSADFEDEDVLIFKVKEDNGKISLQRKNSKHDKHEKYLELNNNNFYLSLEEKWLTIAKKENVRDIADFEEVMKIISLHKEKEKEEEGGKLLIACESYNNKSNETLKNTFKLTGSVQEEHSLTWSTDFTWGISGGLKLGYCGSEVGINIDFEEKTSASNFVKKTKTTTIEKTFDVPCLPWKRVRVKLEAKKVKLFTPYTATVKRVITGRIYEYSIDGEYVRDNYSKNDYSHEEITTRNILLVGCTGSGKSTLANVLLDKKDEKGNFEKVFVESHLSTSKTKFFKKSEEFEWKDNYYCVIDNIGFDDTKLTEKEVLIRLGAAINSTREGLNQVLFVFSGRFSDQEKQGFQKLEALKITNYYITLVRTNFDNFGNSKECKKDRDVLEEQNPKLKHIIDNCRGFLHINNDDERSRSKSRKKVLDYLCNNCSEVFRPKEWGDIGSLVETYFKEREKLENEIQENTAQKEIIEQQIDSLESNTAEQVKEKLQGEEIKEFKEFIELTAQIVQPVEKS